MTQVTSDSIVMWTKLLSIDDRACFKTQTLLGCWENRKSLRWMLGCAWMDFFLAPHLRDKAIEVLRSTINTPRHDEQAQQNLMQDRPPQKMTEMRKQEFEQSSNVDCVLSKTHICKGESQLYNLEMTDEGRSPTLRHVSGTHRDALDWLFVGIDLEHKIKIKYVYTKNKLADTLNTGSCSREWNHLLRLFNIMSRCFLATISAIFFLIRSESRAPCQRKVRMRLPVKVHQ